MSLTVEAKVNKEVVEIKQTITEQEKYIVEDYARFKKMESPTVAVALTGGGAKAFFNIGVIKALKEENIPIDLVVGTSMGSIVAAMYGSGLSIDQIEEVVTTVPFGKLINFSLARDGHFLETDKVNQFLENIAPHKRLENFAIPTAFLSLELDTGNKYLITTGQISDVVQASYAIPYFFPTHQIEKNYFADPGIVENSPAKAAEVLGADFIIATTTTKQVNRDIYKTPEKVVNRYVEIVGDQNTERILNNYADFVIESNVQNYSFVDFAMAEQLIAIGYRDTKEQIAKLKDKLAAQEIPLQERVARKKLDLSQEFNDVKYDRMIVDNLHFNPMIHYGQDYSFFKQDLMRSYLNIAQYGFELDKGHIDFRLLATNNDNNEVEGKLRWRKLTSNLDLVAKARIESNGQNDDGELGLKYYTDNYVLGTGVGTKNNLHYLFADSQFHTTVNQINLDGEVDLFVGAEEREAEVLWSQKFSSELSSIWNIEPKFVYSSTNFIEPTLIYRGTEPNTDFPKFQLAVDYSYTYEFVKTIQLSKIIQIKDIGAYLFTDYIDDRQEGLAYGLGIDSDFYLLGLKPFKVETYVAYDQETEDPIFSLNLNYNF